MAIQVDLRNPPPWVVVVNFPDDSSGQDVTWPFEDELAETIHRLKVGINDD